MPSAAVRISSALCLLIGLALSTSDVAGQDKQVVKAIYIPLADHYAGIIAFEKYRDAMQHADYQIERMKSWPLLRAYVERVQARTSCAALIREEEASLAAL